MEMMGGIISSTINVAFDWLRKLISAARRVKE
jgi:hypothetical protein